MVRDAFAQGFLITRFAEFQLKEIEEQPLFWQRVLWNDPTVPLTSRLSYWFGGSYEPDFSERLAKVRKGISNWRKGFQQGFYANGIKPVYLRCKTSSCFGTRARHILRNTVSLCQPWFDDDNVDARTITMLHEMGHYSGGDAYHPRDERDDECTGGWNVAENMCYRGSLVNRRFTGGNPRDLVVGFEDNTNGRGSEIMDVFLNNVDNYTCYMWNRWVEMGDCIQRTIPWM